MDSVAPHLTRLQLQQNERFVDDFGRRYWFMVEGDVMDRLVAAGSMIAPNPLLDMLKQRNQQEQQRQGVAHAAHSQVEYGPQLFFVLLPLDNDVGFPASATGSAAIYLAHRRTEVTLRVLPAELISPPRPNSRYAYLYGKVTSLSASYERL